MRKPAAAANRLILLELQRLRFRQRLDVRRGGPKTPIAREILLTVCSPRSAKATASLSLI
jgi:hypothetical protein